MARVAENALTDLDAVERVAIPDVPIPYSRPLEDEVIPGVEDVVNAVERTRE